MDEARKPLSEERKALERLIARAVVAILCVVGAALLVPVLWDKLSVFIVCVPVAAMLQPVIRFLERRCHFKRSPAVLVPVLVAVAAVFALIYWFASFGFSQLSSFISNAPALLAEAVAAVRIAFDRMFAAMDSLPPETITWLRTALNDALSWVTIQGTTLGARLVTFLTGMAAGVPYAFVYLNFLIIAMYFVTKEYAAIRAKLPGGRAHDPNTNASRLTRAGIMGALGYLRVQATYGLISLVVGWIYLQCFGFRYAWLIALVAGFLEFLPLFGNGTLYIPWAIIAYAIGMNSVGTEMLVLYLCLITFRRITEPKIMTANIGGTPLLSLIGMFVGMRMGGLLGLMGGPVVMTILYAVVTGHYLDGVNRDFRTLLTYCRHRWDWADPAPYVPKPEDLVDLPAGARAAARGKARRGKANG